MRVKRYKLAYRAVREIGINKELFISLFNQLPKDAKIIKWGAANTTYDYYFIIESSEFQNIEFGQDIPEKDYIKIVIPEPKLSLIVEKI